LDFFPPAISQGVSQSDGCSDELDVHLWPLVSFFLLFFFFFKFIIFLNLYSFWISSREFHKVTDVRMNLMYTCDHLCLFFLFFSSFFFFFFKFIIFLNLYSFWIFSREFHKVTDVRMNLMYITVYHFWFWILATGC